MAPADESRRSSSRSGGRGTPREGAKQPSSGGQRSLGGQRSSRGQRSSGGDRSSSGQAAPAGRPPAGESGSRRSEAPATSRAPRSGDRSVRRAPADRDTGRPSGQRPAPGRSDGKRRRDEPSVSRTESQAAYDGPPIPEHITGKELDSSVSAALKSLPEKLAARVARHLSAAAAVLATDPETAYAHTVAARARAARVALVREASGEAAYAAGRFKEALAEFRAARRMNSSPLYLPMMADSERGLGRPERALALAKDPAVTELDEDGQIEMKIVESGARRDLGDSAAAIRTLEGRELRSRSRASWVPRLRYAYAEALLADGQVDAAREWFERAAGVDTEGATDAADRVAELQARG